jgi:IS5 family transposase
MEERSKHFEVSKRFQEKRTEALERIATEKGIELRVNRSIQSEGTFGNIKENMSFRRFRSRGTENVLVESMLVAMAHNILKLHHKIQGRNQGRYLFPIQISA